LTETLQTEIHDLLQARDFAAIKARCASADVPMLVDLLGELEGEDLAMVFRLLPREQAADVFGDLQIERQEALLELLSSEQVAKILNEMPPDERTELLEDLPGQLAQRFMNTLRGDERQIAQNLLAYPEGSIGRLMTPEYVAARAQWSVQRVLEHIRKVGPDKETLSVVFVVDDRWKLLGSVALEKLILAEPDEIVGELMTEQIVALYPREDDEECVEIFRKYDAVVLPVTDAAGTLVGIVTVDDVMEVAEEETTEDFQRMAGMGPLEYSYFSTGFGAMILKRLPWLVMLLMAQMLTTLALTSFQVVPLFAALVIFMPLINSPAGNAGSQMAGLMLRGMAVQEVAIADWHRVLGRELLRGLAIGIILAGVGYAAAWLFGPMLEQGQHTLNIRAIALSVAVAIVAAVTLANVAGAMLPFFFKTVGLDPAVTSGPFIASMMDVMGIIIYFTTASILLTVMT